VLRVVVVVLDEWRAMAGPMLMAAGGVAMTVVVAVRSLDPDQLIDYFEGIFDEWIVR